MLHRTTSVCPRLEVLEDRAVPTVVGSFPPFGVFSAANLVTFEQVAGVDAIDVAVAPNGDIAASFDFFGVYLFDNGGGLTQLTPVAATNLDITSDDFGNDTIVGSFSPFGLFLLDPSGGIQQLSPAVPSSVGIAPNGDVAASFDFFGVYLFDNTGGLTQLTPAAATAVDIS